MPDWRPRTETLRAGMPFDVGTVTLLPIERVVMHATRGGMGAWLSVAKTPYAMIVRDADGVRALATDAAGVTLEQLRENIPELDAVLASI